VGAVNDTLPVVRVPEPFSRIALVSDVHGNVPALTACLEDAIAEGVEAIVFMGCLTWGPEPSVVLRLTQSLSLPTFFIQGNGERAVLELADGVRDISEYDETLNRWMLERHRASGVNALRGLAPSLSIEVIGVGRMRLCHGSPRSDIELLTPATPQGRLRAAFAGVEEEIVAHGHTHLQYQRDVAGKRVIGPGSVGLPYSDGLPGARWAVVGPGVELRTTSYDLEDAVRAAHDAGYPDGAYSRYVATLRQPPTPLEIQLDAEQREFSD
jgi:predicted phosphodiesterase